MRGGPIWPPPMESEGAGAMGRSLGSSLLFANSSAARRYSSGTSVHTGMPR